MPPTVRRSLPRRAAQTAQLYRHVAVALAKQGPALVLNVPRTLPIVSPVVRGGEAMWNRLPVYRMMAPLQRAHSVARPAIMLPAGGAPLRKTA